MLSFGIFLCWTNRYQKCCVNAAICVVNFTLNSSYSFEMLHSSSFPFKRFYCGLKYFCDVTELCKYWRQLYWFSVQIWGCMALLWSDKVSLRNRSLARRSGCVYVLQSVFFFAFSVHHNLWDNRSRKRLNGFSWKFIVNDSGKIGACNNVPKWRLGPQIIFWGLKTEKKSQWRHLANVDDLRNLRYDSGAITRGATHGGCVIKSWTSEWI